MDIPQRQPRVKQNFRRIDTALPAPQRADIFEPGNAVRRKACLEDAHRYTLNEAVMFIQRRLQCLALGVNFAGLFLDPALHGKGSSSNSENQEL